MTTFSDYAVSLFNLCFFLFDKTDNLIIFIPTFTLFFCGVWFFIIWILHIFWRR